MLLLLLLLLLHIVLADKYLAKDDIEV